MVSCFSGLLSWRHLQDVGAPRAGSHLGMACGEVIRAEVEGCPLWGGEWQVRGLEEGPEGS